MKYKVVRSNELNKLEEEINDYLEDGWSLRGDIVVYVSGVYPGYIQVLVKDTSSSREVINE